MRNDIGAPLFLGGIDIVIVIAGGIAFGLENMLYAVIAIVISTKLSDMIVQGITAHQYRFSYDSISMP